MFAHRDSLTWISKWLVDVNTPQHQCNSPTHQSKRCFKKKKGEGEERARDSWRTVHITMSAPLYTITPSIGLCYCSSAALQNPVLLFAHNFRLVSLATTVSAHGEQPTSPDESFCQYSHDHLEGVRGRERERDSCTQTAVTLSLH